MTGKRSWKNKEKEKEKNIPKECKRQK